MSESGDHIQILLYWGGNIIWNDLGEPGYDRNAGAIDVIRRDCTLGHLVERIFGITAVNQRRYLLKVSTVHTWVNGQGIPKTRMLDLTDYTLPFFLNPINGYCCLELYLDFLPIHADGTHQILDVDDGDGPEEDAQVVRSGYPNSVIFGNKDQFIQDIILRPSPVTQIMPCIPSDLAREILLWLPAESVLRFRAVCKAWRCLIDDPCFVKSHANTQHSSTTLLLKNKVNTRLYLMSWDSLNYEDKCQPIDVTLGKTWVRAGIYRLPNLPVGMCQGLILISNHGSRKIWVICNPLTREFHEVPALPEAQESRLLASGLGYDSVADDYKVVRIDEVRHDGNIVVRTLVYSLKLDSWSTIKDCSCDLPWDIGVFVNGALYWRSRDHMVIIALDIPAEVYRQLPLPPTDSEFDLDMHLNVLDGFLAVCYSYRSNDRFVVWLMKGNGAWMKLFSRSDFGFVDCDVKRPRPIAYWKSKRQVLFETDDNFVWCNVADGSYKKVTIRGLLNFPSCSQICPGSLFRLGGRLDGNVPVKEGLELKERRERALVLVEG